MNFIKIFNILGGRKLIITLLLLSIGLGLQLVGKFDSNFTTFLLGLSGIFAAGNSVEHLTSRIRPQTDTQSNAVKEDV